MNENTTAQAPAQERPKDPYIPTEIKAYARPIEPVKNLLGFASVRLNNGFVVENLKILQGKDGNLFLGMPSAPDGKGGWRETFRPIDKEARAELTQAVVASYEKAMDKMRSTLDASKSARDAAPEQKPSIRGQLQEAARQIPATRHSPGAAMARSDGAR